MVPLAQALHSPAALLLLSNKVFHAFQKVDEECEQRPISGNSDLLGGTQDISDLGRFKSSDISLV